MKIKETNNIIILLFILVFGCDISSKPSEKQNDIKSCGEKLFLNFCIDMSEYDFTEELRKLVQKGIITGSPQKFYTFNLTGQSINADFNYTFFEDDNLKLIQLVPHIKNKEETALLEKGIIDLYKKNMVFQAFQLIQIQLLLLNH